MSDGLTDMYIEEERQKKILENGDNCTKKVFLDELYHELRQLEESVTTLSRIKSDKKVSKMDRLLDKVDRLDNKVDILLTAVNTLIERKD
jgi:hypothetical protein